VRLWLVKLVPCQTGVPQQCAYRVNGHHNHVVMNLPASVHETHLDHRQTPHTCSCAGPAYTYHRGLGHAAHLDCLAPSVLHAPCPGDLVVHEDQIYPEEIGAPVFRVEPERRHCCPSILWDGMRMKHPQENEPHKCQCSIVGGHNPPDAPFPITKDSLRQKQGPNKTCLA
jgi:hypothetical protein